MTFEQLQFFSFIFIVSSGVVFAILERFFPYNKGQKLFRDSFWIDLIGYGIIQSYVLGIVIAWLIHSINGLIGDHALSVRHWPIWVQTIFFIIWHDFNTYVIHRWQHNNPYLWRIHEAHHACKDVDWLSGIRSHSLEILLNQTVEFLPVILLNASPEVALYKGMANAVYGMFIHSNLNVRMGKWLYVINGPELHRWHHANDDTRAYGKNLSTKFPIWDVMFGTTYWPNDKSKLYGSDDPNYPHGYIGQHLYAFRKMASSQNSEATVS